MFKRTILAAVALSMFAVPMAQAQSRHDAPRPGHHYSQPKKPAYHAPAHKRAQKAAPHRHHAQRPAPTRHHWAKGKRVPEWQRRHQLGDDRRSGLRRPGQGQQWVKVDNDYLLISLASGVILGVAAAR